MFTIARNTEQEKILYFLSARRDYDLRLQEWQSG